VSGDAADEIAQPLRLRPAARDLAELMIGISNVDEWPCLAEAWRYGLGDAAHRSRSACIAHSLCLLFRRVDVPPQSRQLPC